MKRNTRKRRFGQIEQLQSRELMAGDMMNAISSYPTENGQFEIRITGTDISDNVRVTENNQGTFSPYDDTLQIRQVSGAYVSNRSYPLYDVNGNRQIEKVRFDAKGGNDFFRNYSSVRSEAEGGSGNDYLRGGSGGDNLNGGVGNDSLVGMDGDDHMDGGFGNDTMFGGNGEDFMEGGYGSDLMYGGNDNDTIQAGGGNDIVRGQAGHDDLMGGRGRDDIDGGSGHDNIWGGDGNDTVSGGSGADAIQGGNGDDVLYGESGHDIVHGDFGNDLIDGGIGNDRLKGGFGNDTLLGQDGVDLMHGEAGYDFLYGGRGNDVLRGGNHDDLIFGGDGVDELFGDLGSDLLSGGRLTVLDVTQANYGSPEFLSVVNDGDYDYLTGGSGRDLYTIGDNYWYTWGHRDRIQDRESGEAVADPHDFSFDGVGIPWFENYGHRANRMAPAPPATRN